MTFITIIHPRCDHSMSQHTEILIIKKWLQLVHQLKLLIQSLDSHSHSLKIKQQIQVKEDSQTVNR